MTTVEKVMAVNRDTRRPEAALCLRVEGTQRSGAQWVRRGKK